MKNILLGAAAVVGVAASSTSQAQNLVYAEDFQSTLTPHFAPFSSGPFHFSGSPQPLVVNNGGDNELQWCDELDIAVAQNATLVSFVLENSAHHDPVFVSVVDHTGSPGTVLPTSVFGYGVHTVQIVAGPYATIHLRGGNCESWVDDVFAWELP
ncbi:MAG: hypothetical protein KTR31_16135 [Myxococcales bacterium]|nr:hypothetical protein [Myxococcales bacterium]